MRIGIGERGEADEPRDIIDRFASVGQQLASLEPERDLPQGRVLTSARMPAARPPGPVTLSLPATVLFGGQTSQRDS
jgi:hypothetical protein